MNYNEYDSNGNKKKFNFTDMVTDKTQRSRMILAIYVIFILILIVFIRVSISGTSNNNDVKKDKTPDKVEPKELDTYDEMFSLIDENNYNFVYKLNYSNELYIASGKRFNNKYSYSFVKEGEKAIDFLGTQNNIKAKVDNEIMDAGLPYRYLNFFDNELIKNILRKSNKIDDNTFEVTNSDLGKIISDFSKLVSEDKNTIKLDIKNNKVVGFTIDYSNATKELLNKEITTTITAQLSNFSLIDDFGVEFE